MRRRFWPVSRLLALLVVLLTLSIVSSCSVFDSSGSVAEGPKTLRIVAGSEQKTVLEQIVQPWCKDNGYQCPFTLLGSVDQARLLEAGSTDYDAYWFASSVFAQVGNKDNKLVNLEPMFLTPTVFAGRRSVMEGLGFFGNSEADVSRLIEIVKADKPKVWATNPTQSNSGATTLFAFLNHFAGNGPGQPLTIEQLNSSEVGEGITAFARGFEQTPPSTGTMMRECVAKPDECDAVFTYEDLVIEQNIEIEKSGGEPFYLVYPKGALAVSDAPFGFLPGNDAESRQNIFNKLQEYLLTDDGARSKLMALGRRPADSVGLAVENADPGVFNPDWGIKTEIKEQAITFPTSGVITETLNRYQIEYRNPVDIYYCLDGSGSMAGGGWAGVKQAATEIFNPDQAARNLLQTGPEDITTVEIFNKGTAGGPWQVRGNQSGDLLDLEKKVREFNPGGGTDMYSCVKNGIASQIASAKKKLIVVMSDGQSINEELADDVISKADQASTPIIAIAFGDADEDQLKYLADGTGGALVTSDDLVKALREAAGYR